MGVYAAYAHEDTQVISNGGTPTKFPFGSHEMAVTYPPGIYETGPDCDDRAGDVVESEYLYANVLWGLRSPMRHALRIWRRAEIVLFTR